MKTNLLLIIIAFAISSCSSKGYKIDGDINGLEGKLYLSLMQGKTPEVVDSTEAVGGKFSFKGDLQLPMYAQLSDGNGNGILLFFLENSTIQIKGSIESPKEIVVEGSIEDALWREYSKKNANVSGDDEYYRNMDSFIDNNPTSVAAAYTFFRLRVPSLNADQMREGVAKFDPSLKDVIYLKMVRERADVLDRVAIGKNYIDFQLPDTDGNVVKFSDVVGHDKYVLLDFWASWCGPCRRENPNVVANFRKYGDKGFTVFGVSLDSKKEDWIDAIAKDSLDWTNVSDLKFWGCEPAAMYGVGSIPSNVLISPEGVIVARNIKGDALSEKLEELLGEK